MEIKNCSIYPRYEESLPKISRIPEFALFMYHRHGKSNRVKCLPHSNGQALSPIPTPLMGISRPGATLTSPQLPAKAPAATPPTTTTTRSRERDRSPDRDHDDDGVRVELSAAATRLTQAAQQAAPQLPAAMETLRSLRRAREAKPEGPLDAVLDKVRDDLV